METKFADGVIAKEGKFNEQGKPHVRLSIKVDEFAKFVKENVKDGWLNVEVKTGKSGKVYVALDTFVPKKQENTAQAETDNLPF